MTIFLRAVLFIYLLSCDTNLWWLGLVSLKPKLSVPDVEEREEEEEEEQEEGGGGGYHLRKAKFQDPWVAKYSWMSLLAGFEGDASLIAYRLAHVVLVCWVLELVSPALVLPVCAQGMPHVAPLDEHRTLSFRCWPGGRRGSPWMSTGPCHFSAGLVEEGEAPG
eukprot:1156163-Pelagomonas_calceolata.AAC.4